MTTIKITKTDEYGFRWLKVNDRVLGTPERIAEVKKVGPGRWKGIANGEEFIIEGGKEAGGGAADWFLDWAPLSDRTVQVASAKEAIVMIERS